MFVRLPFVVYVYSHTYIAVTAVQVRVRHLRLEKAVVGFDHEEYFVVVKRSEQNERLLLVTQHNVVEYFDDVTHVVEYELEAVAMVLLETVLELQVSEFPLLGIVCFLYEAAHAVVDDVVDPDVLVVAVVGAVVDEVADVFEHDSDVEQQLLRPERVRKQPQCDLIALEGGYRVCDNVG